MGVPEEIRRSLEQLKAQFAEALSVHNALVGGTLVGADTLRSLKQNGGGLAERGPRAMEQMRQRLMEVGLEDVDFTQAAAILNEVMIGSDSSEPMWRSALAHSVGFFI